MPSCQFDSEWLVKNLSFSYQDNVDREKGYPGSCKQCLLLRFRDKCLCNAKITQTFRDALLHKPTESDQPRNFTEQVRHEQARRVVAQLSVEEHIFWCCVSSRQAMSNREPKYSNSNREQGKRRKEGKNANSLYTIAGCKASKCI